MTDIGKPKKWERYEPIPEEAPVKEQPPTSEPVAVPEKTPDKVPA